MRFEKQTDLQREMKAIKLFTDGFKGGFIKFHPRPIGYARRCRAKPAADDDTDTPQAV